MNMIEFFRFGLNSPSSCKDSSPFLSMNGSHSCTKQISTAMCTINWTATEMLYHQWKIEVGGLSFSNFLRGLENESIINRNEIPIPRVVAWQSPIFTPSRQRALIVQAEMGALRDRILYIQKVVVRVLLPYLMSFLTDLRDWNLQVNGAAIQASPSSNCCSPPAFAISCQSAYIFLCQIY